VSTWGNNQCGTNKVYNPAASASICAGCTCDSSNEDDKTACCGDQAQCSTVSSWGNTECGTGKMYNSAASASYCASTTCDFSTEADVTACCANENLCSTVSTWGTAECGENKVTQCGTNKVYDPADSASDCASTTVRQTRQHVVATRLNAAQRQMGRVVGPAPNAAQTRCTIRQTRHPTVPRPLARQTRQHVVATRLNATQRQLGRVVGPAPNAAQTRCTIQQTRHPTVPQPLAPTALRQTRQHVVSTRLNAAQRLLGRVVGPAPNAGKTRCTIRQTQH